MTVKQKAEAFVKKYPSMFTEDQEWWAETLAEHFSDAEQLRHVENEHVKKLMTNLNNKRRN